MNLGFLKETKEFDALLRSLSRGNRAVDLSGICEAAKPYFMTMLLASSKRPIVFIRPASASLFPFKEECDFFITQIIKQSGRSFPWDGGPDNGDSVSVLPYLSNNPYNEFPPSLDAVSNRMLFFHQLMRQPPALVLTNLLGLLKPFPCQKSLQSAFLSIEVNESLDRDIILQRIASYGYSKEDLVNAHGEYAWRGGIVDVFSPWRGNPFRIEFSGDHVASLREFDSSSQRSIRRMDRVTIPALHEFPASQDFFSEWVKITKKETGTGASSDLEAKVKDLHTGNFIPSFAYLSLLHKTYYEPFTHYLKDSLYVIDEPDDLEKEWKENLSSFKKLYTQSEKKGEFVLPPQKIFLTDIWNKIKKNAVRFSRVAPLLSPSANREDKDKISFLFQPTPRFENKIPFFIEYLKRMQREREQCFLFFTKKGVLEKMAVLLTQEGIPYLEINDPLKVSPKKAVCLTAGNLSHGFSYPSLKLHFFAENDIFTEEKVLARRPSFKPFESFFRDLQSGDFVVHTDYGIGVFIGLVKMDVEKRLHEFIQIDYMNKDKLYIPVEDMDLVQKYAGVGTVRPVIHKLGTPVWEKSKVRTKKAVEKIAKELLDLYAKRKTSQGHSFSAEGEWGREFNETFEYDETEDQSLAIKSVYHDMESSVPMDRLLCGDVGYGKTEVAMRAAFKAVMDGKQVGVLCPTTVLASQHLKTFQNRMSLFPVQVKSLTRLQNMDNQKKTLRSLEAGLVDIIIGTHRLLSGDIKFKDLGLLIIDEEQRFGVKQKEKIKQLKAEIDVLTLTATPIPRTLNLSLSGLRDISLIETPPKDRLAIHTVVTSFHRKLVQDAIKKEMSREGQVYFIHNKIHDIEIIANKIRSWIPGIRVVVIHGKMTGSSLECNMIDFIQHKYDVLISTTIIENGIDIPLVNTLIVNEADRFGLAQLYQLRGRVGRSSKQAVAYLLISPRTELSGQAEERLKALQEFSELGSGFRLAAKDLEIRGAGHFLGSEQHGYVEAVGFDYYMHLLRNAVRDLKEEPAKEVASEINMKVDIRIPEDYLPQMTLRLNLYKRISSIENESEIEKIKDEISDMYGPPAQSVSNLLGYGVIKFLSHKLKIRKLDRSGKDLILDFYPDTPVEPIAVTGILKTYQGAMTQQEVLSLRLRSSNEPSLVNETISILKRLEGM